jgi:hypothetical protein
MNNPSMRDAWVETLTSTGFRAPAPLHAGLDSGVKMGHERSTVTVTG